MGVGTIGLRSCRYYCSKPRKRVDFEKIRPMILKRIENRAKDYPVKPMVPVARKVLKDRTSLYRGVATLLQRFPIFSCKHCSEVHIGESGHMIRTCGGFRRRPKVHVHEWINGGLKDILLPVETFHLHKMFQKVIGHDQRFDFDRIPAVVELCWQAGAYGTDNTKCLDSCTMDSVISECAIEAGSLSGDDILEIASGTLKAWEGLRAGVQKLMLVYPVKVCEHCSEVHVGPSGHKARLCGVFKCESWYGKHFWRQAKVDDLVPPKIVWCQRPQDPPVLKDEGRSYYGHAPAVVELCRKVGILAPSKYHCMMKLDGLTVP